MFTRGLTISLLLSAIVWLAPHASADSADKARQLYESGRQLLAQGDFDAALKSYQAAAEANPEELNYQVRAAVLKRVISLRQALPKLENGPKWQPTIKALYAYYSEHGAHGEALSVANEFHAKAQSPDAVPMIANAHLNLSDNAAALEVLQKLPKDKMTPRSHALAGIACARLGQLDQAREHLSQIRAPEKPDAALGFELARLQTLLGDTDSALGSLTTCFENTTPSRLGIIKQQAKSHTDLAGLQKAAAFARVLDTQSKITESKCSSGASCAQCPSRASCGSSQDEKEKKTDKP